MNSHIRAAIIVIMICFWSFSSRSTQAEESGEGEAVFILPPVVVTATRTERPTIEVPYAVEILESSTIIEEKQSRTIPEALKETPGVMVQKTANGQGSLYIRGFTGYRTLMLIDGIRLNNSVFRDGPNQYWSTVDPFVVQRLELVKGPSSVLYGSDAIGGTMNVITKRPGFGKDWYDTDLVYRYSSAENSNIGRAQLDLGPTESLGFLGGISYKDFGDVRAAGIGLQPHTGYDEVDGDVKAEYRLAEGRSIVVAHQRVSQDDVWRTHYTIYGLSWEGTTVGTDQKYATDQDRNLTYVQYHDRPRGGLVDSVDLSLSFQQQKEDQDRIRSNGNEELQGFDCGTTGVSGQVSSSLGFLGIVTGGIEYYRDDVDSYKLNYSATGAFLSEEIQGPVADDAQYDLAGLYLQDEVFLGDRASVLLGGRYTYARAEADRVKDPVTGSQISLSKSWDNVVGNIRGQYFVIPQEWSLYTGVGQGFRAPNFSDLTSFQNAFGYVETPSTDIDPEKYVTYETGIKGESGRVTAQIAYFYTDMSDLIVRYPTGETVGENNDPEFKKANAGDGYIYGYEVYLNTRVIPAVQCYGMLTWMKGRIDQPQLDSSGNLVYREDYVSKLQPLTTIVGLRYDDPFDRYWTEGLATFAAKQDELSLTDRMDNRIPPGGNPSYTVVTVRGGVKVWKYIQAVVALENVFDEEYRVLGSGQNEPGRNLIATLEGKF